MDGEEVEEETHGVTTPHPGYDLHGSLPRTREPAEMRASGFERSG